VSLRWLWGDRFLWVLAGLLFVGMGVFNAVATWLDSILTHFGHGGASGGLIAVMTAGYEGVDVRVAEHLYRWVNWEIKSKSDPYRKTDSQTIEFPIHVAPDAERKITYTVHYSW